MGMFEGLVKKWVISKLNNEVICFVVITVNKLKLAGELTGNGFKKTVRVKGSLNLN